MPQTLAEKKKALTRIRRIKGQATALEKALEDGAECAAVLQQLAAIRGAVNGLMAATLENHLREEFPDGELKHDTQKDTIDETISIIRSYLR